MRDPIKKKANFEAIKNINCFFVFKYFYNRTKFSVGVTKKTFH